MAKGKTELTRIVTPAVEPPPVFIPPQLPKSIDKPPLGPDWIHEIKYDGYRIQARLDNHVPRLRTRNGNDWTQHFHAVADELTRLGVHNALLDGEVILERSDGTSSFRELRSITPSSDQSRLRYYVFYLLYLNGQSLLDRPLMARKDLLQGILPENTPHVCRVEYLEHIDTNIMPRIRELKIEGIVSKHIRSRYRSGRSDNWLKIKAHDADEMVVGGFTGTGRVNGLLVGYYRNNSLRFAGHVNYSMHGSIARNFFTRLNRIAQNENPFQSMSVHPRKVTWVKPQIVVQVRHWGWSKTGLLRRPSFQGVREDKSAREVTYEPR